MHAHRPFAAASAGSAARQLYPLIRRRKHRIFGSWWRRWWWRCQLLIASVTNAKNADPAVQIAVAQRVAPCVCVQIPTLRVLRVLTDQWQVRTRKLSTALTIECSKISHWRSLIGAHQNSEWSNGKLVIAGTEPTSISPRLR